MAENGTSAAPHNVEAEAALLGGLLLNNSAIGPVVEKLDEHAFYRRANQLIFKEMAELYDQRKGFDPVILAESLEKAGHLEEAGGPEYLAHLMDSVPSSANVTHYTSIVHEKAILRDLLSVAQQIMSEATTSGKDPTELLDEAERLITHAGQSRLSKDPVDMASIVGRVFQEISDLKDNRLNVSGLRTGLHDLDKQTSGMHGGQLIVLAGRPGMGKTSLALRIAENVCLQEKKGVVLFSLEMRAEAIVKNMICAHAKVQAKLLREGIISDTDMVKITTACGVFHEAPMFILDQSLNIVDLRNRVRRMKFEHDIKLVIIDYLQLLDIRGGGSTRIENRQQEIAYISRQLKSLALELDIVVLALSQLSREVEKREDNKPRMSDLRESGAIEQDADSVILIYRKDYYEKGVSPEDQGVTWLNVAKQRSGPTGEVQCLFLSKFMRFENLDTKRRQSEPE